MSKRKPYKAKSLSGAQSYVRALKKRIDAKRRLIEQFASERKLLAMLAAEGPAFHNPLVAMSAKEVRNRILRDDCGMNPDGTPIKLKASVA